MSRFLSQPPTSLALLDAIHQLVGAHRLREKVAVGKMALVPVDLVFVHQRSEENRRRVSQRGIFPKHGAQIASVDFRHHDVEQDHIGMKRVSHHQRRGRIVVLANLIPAGGLQV
jgi:hypothetical protein